MECSFYRTPIVNRMMELGLSIPADNLDDYEMPIEDQQRVFKSQYMTCKKDILKEITNIRNDLKKNIYYGKAQNESFCKILDRMYGELYKDVSSSMLFDAPEYFWHYVIEQDSKGIRLILQNVDGEVNDCIEYEYDAINDGYTMMQIDAYKLTIEEYAQIYGVQTVTVRQWIRRGKIRTAEKCGNEWRISELAEIPNKERGYRKAVYSWEQAIEPVPENYEFINDFSCVVITQDDIHKNRFLIDFRSPERVNNEEKWCDAAERERFELFLISHPNVKYSEPINMYE